MDTIKSPSTETPAVYSYGDLRKINAENNFTLSIEKAITIILSGAYYVTR